MIILWAAYLTSDTWITFTYDTSNIKLYNNEHYTTNSYETKETLNETRMNTALTWEQILPNWQIITQALMSFKYTSEGKTLYCVACRLFSDNVGTPIEAS